VEDDRHGLNENVVLVGASSKARKGSSWGKVRRVFELADQGWTYDHVAAGLSSGEGLIQEVRDETIKREAIKEKGRPTGEYIEVVDDPGVRDKRLLTLEAEFANVLKVMTREGNTLSVQIRHAWDHGNLRSMTKSSPARATNAHISAIGHITRDELRRCLDTTEAANGFGNRYLWLAVRRSNVLPRGGRLKDADVTPLVTRLGQAIVFGKAAGEIQLDDEAWEIWEAVYPELSEGKPGLLGAMIARGEAHVRRFASIYALLDCSVIVRKIHIEAALALWGYAEASACWIFGASLGDPIADEILRTLRGAGSQGLTRTEIGDLFKQNQASARIGRALDDLVEHGLARFAKGPPASGRGRPAERWYLL
jgi:hypothetical protein